MQTYVESRPARPRTRHGLRAQARADASQLRDALARLISEGPGRGAEEPNLLFAISGHLDDLDAAVRRTIDLLPDPASGGWVELLARIDACIDAAVDLAFVALDPPSPEFASIAESASAKIQSLLDLVGAPDNAASARA